MHERIQTRLEELRKEFETGQAELDKLKKQRTYLRETLLRISGALQVLEELLAKEQSMEQPNGAGLSEVKSTSAQPTNIDEHA
jgi:predicted nuclease with TOPRIM domain